jgi:integrase/recombinase XerD
MTMHHGCSFVVPIVLGGGAVRCPLLDVLGREVRVVEVPDQFLRHMRFDRDGAESTTEMYAGATASYLKWCAETPRNWATSARQLGMFMVWLR